MSQRTQQTKAAPTKKSPSSATPLSAQNTVETPDVITEAPVLDTMHWSNMHLPDNQERILQMQRIIGNQATMRMVGSPVAQRSENSPVSDKKVQTAFPWLQRSPAGAIPVHGKTAEPRVQRASEDEKMTKAAGKAESAVNENAAKVLALYTPSKTIVDKATPSKDEQKLVRKNRSTMKDRCEDVFKAIKPLSAFAQPNQRLIDVIASGLTALTTAIAQVEVVNDWLKVKDPKLKNKEWPQKLIEMKNWSVSIYTTISGLTAVQAAGEALELWNQTSTTIFDSISTIELLSAGNKSKLLEAAEGGGTDDLGGGLLKKDKPDWREWMKNPLETMKTAIRNALPENVIEAFDKIRSVLEKIPFVSAIVNMISAGVKLAQDVQRWWAFRTAAKDANAKDASLRTTQDQTFIYAEAKTKRGFLSSLSGFIRALIKGISRLITFFSGGTAAIVTESIALATDLVGAIATLYRKGKGIYKYFSGTRGKNRKENATRVYDAALGGDSKSQKLMLSLNVDLNRDVSTGSAIKSGVGKKVLSVATLGVSNVVSDIAGMGGSDMAPGDLQRLLKSIQDNNHTGWRDKIIDNLADKMKSF